MHVVHIEAGRHLYGGARQVLSLIDGAGRAGARSTLLCPAGSEIAEAAARSAARPEIVELPMRGDLDVRAIGRYRRAIAARRPDLVHVHSRRGADLFGGLACAGAPWPAVLTRRVDEREPRAWARLKYRPYSALIAISRAVRTELVEHAGVPGSRVHVVPSGVDPRAYRPAPAARSALVAALDLPADACIAGIVAQLIPRKGHRVILDALPAVVARHPRVVLVCFGRGPEEGALRREIERRGLGAHARLAGFHVELGSLLPGLDLLVHPARAEGLGLAVLEAMAAGLPVAASAAGGLVDVIEDGTSGLLVPPGDVPAWASALGRLLDDADLRLRLGAAARRRVEAAFTAERMVAGNLGVYRSVLGRAARRGRPARRAGAAAQEREA